ncbi:MAG: hypothetical protein DRJ51_08755 [Thermoprotei archaeon]|nr:MAG: hypothetical protein DRJ51_08755 [Thermoprotei archaeon]
MRTVTVSAKVSRELWAKLKKYRVNISEVVRRALEEEVRRREEEELRRLLEEAAKVLSKIPQERIVKHVREGREER